MNVDGKYQFAGSSLAFESLQELVQTHPLLVSWFLAGKWEIKCVGNWTERV